MNKHLLNFGKSLFQPRSIKNGENFEDSAWDLFPERYYATLHKSHDVITNSARFIESSLHPDYQFRDIKTGFTFWVECKYRDNANNSNIIYPFKDGQLKRYKSYKNSFLLLSTYDNDSPVISLIPFSKINFEKLFMSFILTYKISDFVHPQNLIDIQK